MGQALVIVGVAISAAYHGSRVLRQAFLSSLLGVLVQTAPARANCDGFPSACVHADTQPPNPQATTFLTLPSQSLAGQAVIASFHVSYQHRPLELVAAAPDPYGRRVALLRHWWIAYPQFAYAISRRWIVGAQLPMTLSPDKPGLAGYQPRSYGVFVGDPAMTVVFQDAGKLRWFVGQEITLPLGEPGSFANAPRMSYSPSLAFASTVGTVELAAKVGLALKGARSYSGARFGSAAELGLGAAYRSNRSTIGIELTLSPSLLRDLSPEQRRRVPADWLLNVTQDFGPFSLFLGAGSSVPLSQMAHSSALTAGPPGAAFRGQVGFIRSSSD